MDESICGSKLPPGTTCYVVDYSSQDTDVVACVPNEGLILLRCGRVIGFCDVGAQAVSRIAIFFTYQPFCKHYVLQCESVVKVVSHLSQLKVTHTFDDVIKFEVSDFRNQGVPQLGLWKGSEESFCVTDLTASFASSSTNPVENVLSTKLKSLKFSVDKVCKQLEGKRRMRKHCMFHILGTDNCDVPQQESDLVTFMGNSSAQLRKTNKNLNKNSILVSNSWQRLLDRKWILGCNIQNNSSKPLRALSLCVCRADEGVEDGVVEWRIMVPRTEQGQPYVTLGPDGVLEPSQRAFVVAAVPEPAFLRREPCEEVGGLVSALLPDGRETWTAVPPWRLTVDAVLRGKLVPFRGPATTTPNEVDPGLGDVLASLACCPVDVQLRLDGRTGLSDRVRRLLDDVDLRPARGAPASPQGAVGMLVGSGPPEAPLHGALALLLVRSPASCSLRLHVRDRRHVFLLVHRLLAGLPQHTKLTAADDDPADLDVLARALLRALEDELGAWAGGAPARPALHPLELATDLAAQRLRVATA
ncbi:uncharacterized protein LOC113207010 isoform X2 [Frankliniella occidentalis]|nr:uncharacterized protein LOC113207010 isoform X2 [Frankliniella occidentalis]XP_052120224.1 uncharacterized protein LOC113207010 isoform X2 [Frankliniella occidentalis]